MSRKIRTKKVISDREELVDLSDGISKSIDLISKYADIPFGLPTTNISENTMAKTGGVYTCLPGPDEEIILTLQRITPEDQGRVVIIRNDDAYGAGSLVSVVPSDTNATISGEGIVRLEPQSCSLFMARPDRNWIAFPFVIQSESGNPVVKVSSDDTTADYLQEKTAAGTGIFLNVLNSGGDEEIEINLDAHASTHQEGGSDEIKLDDLAEPDDNTDLNASTSKHGLLPRLSGEADRFLDGYGNWSELFVSSEIDIQDGYAAWGRVEFNRNQTPKSGTFAAVDTWEQINNSLVSATWDGYSDGAGNVSVDANDFSITVNVAGTYKMDFNVDVQMYGGASDRVGIYKNGTLLTETLRYRFLSNPTALLPEVFFFDCESGDYFEVWGKTADSSKYIEIYNLNMSMHHIKAEDPVVASDYKTYVSDDDTSRGFLEQKIVAGDSIIVTVLNPGGDEQLEINLQSHKTSHQNGGSDEINVSGLSGLLADAQTPLSHAVTHQDGYADEIDVTGLSGLLADSQTPLAHASTHQDGGSDEISVSGLSGLLADAQTPLSHASTHENGGADEIDVTGLSGLLADSQTPLAHNTSHQSGGSDAIKLDDLATPDDNTDLDATSSRHGLLPKLNNDGYYYLDGTGNWTIPGVPLSAAANGVVRWNTSVDFTLTTEGVWYPITYGCYPSNLYNMDIDSASTYVHFEEDGDYIVNWQFVSDTIPSAGYYLVSFQVNGSTVYYPNARITNDLFKGTSSGGPIYLNNITSGDDGYLVVQRAGGAGATFNVGYLGMVITKYKD